LDARLILTKDLAIVSFDDHPGHTIGKVLNAFSQDGRWNKAPDDYDHQANWEWRVLVGFVPALRKVLGFFGVSLQEVPLQEGIRD